MEVHPEILALQKKSDKEIQRSPLFRERCKNLHRQPTMSQAWKFKRSRGKVFHGNAAPKEPEARSAP